MVNARRILIPIFVLSCAFILSFFGLGAVDLEKKTTTQQACLLEIWDQTSDLNVDILFIGSSRTRASINANEISYYLEQASSSKPQIRVMVFPGPNQSLRYFASNSLINKSEVPEIVIIENMFTQRGPEVEYQLVDTPFSAPMPVVIRNVATHEFMEFEAAQIEVSEHFEGTYFRTSYTNPVQFKLNQVSATIKDVIKKPKIILTNKTKDCANAVLLDEVLSKGSAPKKPELVVDQQTPRMKKKAFQRNLEQAKSLIPLEPSSSMRTYDVATMRALIHLYREAGVKQIWVWLPNDMILGYDPEIDKQLNEIYDEADRVYYKEIIELLRPYDKDQIFRNANHLNDYGRAIESVFWAQELAKFD